MLKSSIFASAIILGASAPAAQIVEPDPVSAEQTRLKLPNPDAVVAQFSYLEIRHGIDGFGLSITDETSIFLDFEFSGKLYIRIGF